LTAEIIFSPFVFCAVADAAREGSLQQGSVAEKHHRRADMPTGVGMERKIGCKMETLYPLFKAEKWER
jgi:hypothetical protein